jgi:hypothetical protein
MITAAAWVVPAAGASTLVLRSEQSLPALYNQGIARVADGWIISGTNSPVPATDVLARTDEAFSVLAVNPAAIPPEWRAQGYSHIGDIDVVGDVVYAPFEQPDYEQGRQVTARYDAASLQFIDAVVLPQHENSFVAVDASTMTAYSMDRFDGDTLLRYDIAAGWKPLAALQLSELLHHTQGASIADGALWLSTSDEKNRLYRIDLATGHVDLLGEHGHPGGEGEGIAVVPLATGYLHTMVIDPDHTSVWVEHFDLATGPPATPGGPAPTTAGAPPATGAEHPATAAPPATRTGALLALLLGGASLGCSRHLRPRGRRPPARRRPTPTAADR